MKTAGRIMLIVLCFFVGSIMPCPSECSCPNLQTVECVEWNAQSITQLPKTTLTLNIQGGNLTTLTSNSFKGLTDINSIIITDTKLENIEPNTFNGLGKLFQIILKNNQISVLSNHTFNNLASLTAITLENNKISSISRNCFYNLPKLRSLSLYKNLLSGFEEGTFSNNLSTMITLSLSSNKLTYINKLMFKELIKLTYLELQKNAIKRIEEGSFESLAQLKYLYLYENNLTELSKNVFIGLENLYFADLNFNYITGIDWSFFHHTPINIIHLQYNQISEITYSKIYSVVFTRTIKLLGNPLNCSCGTVTSLLTMAKHGIIINNGTFKTPSFVEGFSINDLREKKSIIKCKIEIYCIYNLDIDCTNPLCPQNISFINCYCENEDRDNTRSCSDVIVERDCRTHGCEMKAICAFNQLQWKCKYVCNNTECKNNGKCIPNNKNFTCECEPGFSGLLCEKTKTYVCDNTECKNNGKCIPNNKKFTCDCDTGFREKSKTYLCNNTECMNNGKFIPNKENFTCSCKTGFSGLACEVIERETEETFFDTKTIVLIIVVGLLISSIVVILIKYICCKRNMGNEASGGIPNDTGNGREQDTSYSTTTPNPNEMQNGDIGRYEFDNQYANSTPGAYKYAYQSSFLDCISEQGTEASSTMGSENLNFDTGNQTIIGNPNNIDDCEPNITINQHSRSSTDDPSASEIRIFQDAWNRSDHHYANNINSTHMQRHPSERANESEDNERNQQSIC